MNIPTSINKVILWKYVNLKIKRAIGSRHVYSVIHILFNELYKDIIAGRRIRIGNLGTIVLQKTAPRIYFSVVHQKKMKSFGYKVLRFVPDENFREKLFEYLDVEKTFEDQTFESIK
jgi:nucleoid DNA-binding protein